MSIGVQRVQRVLNTNLTFHKGEGEVSRIKSTQKHIEIKPSEFGK